MHLEPKLFYFIHFSPKLHILATRGQKQFLVMCQSEKLNPGLTYNVGDVHSCVCAHLLFGHVPNDLNLIKKDSHPPVLDSIPPE